MKQRLQKLFSEQGICSRRAAEKLIIQGRVKVNGITASLGEGADVECDSITLDGTPVLKQSEKHYIMLNKPRGYVTTLSDEVGRPQVGQLVEDLGARVFPVGRLDMHSEGLLIMTNDGALAHALTHPSHEVYKQYLLKITIKDGQASAEPPEAALARPMTLDGVNLASARCTLLERDGAKCILSISIREGKNRQIRRMCAALGYTVNGLKRVAVGDVKLGDLPGGKWRYLTDTEVKYLKGL